MRWSLLSILLIVAATRWCGAKDNYEMSLATGLEEVGINKVLCMKNGNTLLFHFEINKPVEVMVFDTARKRIATAHPICNLLDVMMLPTAVFKGLHEIGGEAVLFFEQQNSGRHSLIRLRFNPLNGKLIDESTLCKSPGLAKPARFFVMKQRNEDGYEVLYCQDVLQFKDAKVYVTYYNERHEVLREVPLPVDRKKYDYMYVVGAESRPEGVCVTLGLSNLVVNGTGNTMGTMAVYGHFLQVFYIPKDGKEALHRTAALSTDIVPYYTHFTHNPFAGTINLMLLCYRDAMYQYGTDLQPTALLANQLFQFSEQDLSVHTDWFTNKLANELLDKIDTNRSFVGFPLRMITNSNGLSTLVSEGYDRYFNTETNSRSQVFETYFGNFCITQFDDNGKELWGTVLPHRQYYKSYRQYYRPADLAKRWQQQAMFNDLPPQVFERQFMSGNVYAAGGNIYLIYNDCDKNFANNIQSPGDTSFTSALTNACYYKINRKKEVEKHYLLGEALPKEYRSSQIEGADFDEQRNTYASLIRYKRGEYVSLRMAWVKME